MGQKKFLVCIDSDGCAIDTMDAKHKLCFAPLMVEKWHMEAHRAEAEEFVSRAGRRQYDLIFLDPPYGGVILENALLQIETFDILSTDGIIICESAVGDRFAHGFEVVRERRYGATMITVLRRQNGGTDERHENCDLPGQL